MDDLPPLLDDATFRRLARARDFGAASLGGPVSLHAMAREACLSPFHFHRLFRSAFGETPHDFLTRLRIERAKRLIRAGDCSVTEACLEAGYSSLGSFSAKFRALTGLSPSDYRAEHRRVYGAAALARAVFIPSCFISLWATAN